MNWEPQLLACSAVRQPHWPACSLSAPGQRCDALADDEIEDLQEDDSLPSVDDLEVASLAAHAAPEWFKAAMQHSGAAASEVCAQPGALWEASRCSCAQGGR